MSFQSFYWNGASLPAAEHSLTERLGDPEAVISEQKRALLTLLASSNTVARGMALDHYSMANASRRHGDNPVLDEVVDAAARACALRELAEPPFERPEANAKPKRGANHASALHALWFNSDPADAQLLVSVLLENQDERVLSAGVGASEPVLRGQPAHPGLVDALFRIADRCDVDPRVRGGAIDAIGGALGDNAEALLVTALGSSELAVSAAAARRLLERDPGRYRSAVERAMTAWRLPEFPPFDVHEVHRLLEGE